MGNHREEKKKDRNKRKLYRRIMGYDLTFILI